MSNKMENKIFRLLNSFINVCPKLYWHRFTATEKEYTFYGWISRNDKKKDFLVINFSDPKDVWYCTSSVEYSETFARLLKSPHRKCQNIINLFNKMKKPAEINSKTKSNNEK